ncbi:MAG: phosphonoacetaldehyde reductase [bacterium]
MDSSLYYDISVLAELIDDKATLFITMPGDILNIADKKGTVRKIINDMNLEHLTYSGSALPVEDVQSLYDAVKEKEFSSIVAVGGGTIMDIAKIIGVALSNKLKKIEQILEDPNGFSNEKRFVFVPTTCGTGSEATHFAVVYKDGRKHSVANDTIKAQSVILDHTLLLNLPENIRNATVLDALSQAIESMWAKNSTDESKDYSKEALKLILKGIESEELIEKLQFFQKGSYLAGKAINISKTTLPHAISYPLTAKFGIAHGVAVFLTLPEIAELNYCEKTKPVFKEIFDLFNVRHIEDLKQNLKNIMEKMGFSPDLSKYGVLQDHFRCIAEHSIVPGRSDNNPVEIDVEEIIDILKKIWLL